MPAASAASTTSSSRTEPPGWMIAVTPASIASCGPSANGKNASEASAAPCSDSAVRLLDREAHRVHAAHLAGADARPVARSLASTIALERTCLQTFQAKSISPHSRLGRLALGDDLHLRAVLEVHVAVLHQQPAHDALDVGLADARACGARCPRGCAGSACALSTSSASSEKPGAKSTSTNCSKSASASSRVDRAVERDDAAEGATAGRTRTRARRRRAPAPPTATPHGLLCLTIAHAGQLELVDEQRARALRSSRLLNDSSLPSSCLTSRARACARRPGA